MINIMTLEVLIQQLEEGDEAVFDVVTEILKADLTQDETNRINEMFTDVYNKIPMTNINDVQMSLALYSLDRGEEVVKFLKWVNDRLELFKKGTWTKEKFISKWNKAYNGILDKMSDETMERLDRLAIANIVYFINDLKEKGELK